MFLSRICQIVFSAINQQHSSLDVDVFSNFIQIDITCGSYDKLLSLVDVNLSTQRSPCTVRLILKYKLGNSRQILFHVNQTSLRASK